MQQMNPGTMTPEQKVKNLRIIYAAMLATPLIYGVVCELIFRFTPEFVKNQGFAHLPDAQYNILKTGILLACGILTVLILLCRMAINSERADGIAYLLMKETLNSKADDHAMTQTMLIGALAACESVGVLGLILFLTNGDKAMAYPLLGLDFILMLLFMPTQAFREKMIQTRKNSLRSW